MNASAKVGAISRWRAVKKRERESEGGYVVNELKCFSAYQALQFIVVSFLFQLRRFLIPCFLFVDSMIDWTLYSIRQMSLSFTV